MSKNSSVSVKDRCVIGDITIDLVRLCKGRCSIFWVIDLYDDTVGESISIELESEAAARSLFKELVANKTE